MPNATPWSADTALLRLDDVQKRIAQNTSDTRHVYTQLFPSQDAMSGATDTALSGALVSIKDLLDVKGQVTRTGTTFMAKDTPADQDADVVARLRAAGCVLVGHTNMTELAYSGLGLNPHYGTPENALYPGCIPGGSTSGGAISVAQGLADIAVGTDTGGSLRIPAAFNGIVGFKPTQSTVSRRGCKNLSHSLDSIGPMAKTVEGCRAAYAVMADPDQSEARAIKAEFVIPENFGLDDLERPIAAGFQAAVDLLTAQGHVVTRRAFQALDQMKTLPIWQFSAVESRAHYDVAYQTQRAAMDPRVASRMGRADEATAVSYCQTLLRRDQLIAAFQQELDGRVLLMPTVPILPPSFDAMLDDATFGRVNLQALRNPTIANVMNCCSISLPFVHDGDTMGVMLTATAHSDAALLTLAQTCQDLFQAS